MIKAKELRIGNLLTHDARTCSVTSLIENGESNYDIETRFVKGGEVRFNSIIYVGLEPIKLTEEWLIRFGFGTGKKIGYSGNDFINDTMTVILGEHLIKIKHVHQLQNLYFALTGEELTIKETVKCLGGCGNKVSSAKILFCSTCENQQ